MSSTAELLAALKREAVREFWDELKEFIEMKLRGPKKAASKKGKTSAGKIVRRSNGGKGKAEACGKGCGRVFHHRGPQVKHEMSCEGE